MKRFALILAGFVIFVAVGFPIFRWATWEDVDLDEFAPLAETQAYDKLIAQIQATPLVDGGFTFVALGDTRSNIQMAKNVLGAAKEEKPAFIFANGDIVRKGNFAGYRGHHMKLVEFIDPIPFITAPGNHEDGPNRDFAGFRAMYGDERFSFEYGDCRFVGLNNCDWDGMSGADLDYLDAELSKPAKHRFVTFHIPPLFLENAVETEEGRGFTWNAKKFRALMTRHKVDNVFLGHIHGFASEVIDGVRYTITGGGGANLATQLGEEGAVHNFVLVKVGPEGLTQEVHKYINETWQAEPIE